MTKPKPPTRLTPRQLHETHRWIQLDEVEQLPANPNLGDEESLSKSLEEFGWFDGIVIHKGVIIAGNHRFDSARAAGEEGLPGYDLSAYPIKDARKMAMALAHNHTSRAGANDPELLMIAAEGLSSLSELTIEAAGLPTDVITGIVPPSLKEPGAPEGADIVDFGDLETEHRCPRCQFEF